MTGAVDIGRSFKDGIHSFGGKGLRIDIGEYGLLPDKDGGFTLLALEPGALQLCSCLEKGQGSKQDGRL